MLVRLRHLIFESMTANVDGVAAVLARIPDLVVAVGRSRLDASGFATALDYWPFLLGGLVGAQRSLVVTLIGWWALSQVLSRLLGIPDVHKLEAPATAVRSRPCRCG